MRYLPCTILTAFALTAVAAASPFEIDTVITGAGGTATGTSNGIGYSLSPTFVWADRTTTDNTWSFTGANFLIPMPDTDRLHIGGDPFTLTFAQPIGSALIYLTENDSDLSGFLDFGISPTVLSGDISVSGTAFRSTTPNGGLVRLDGINSTTLSNISDTDDGHDFAIVVNAVPEPTSLAALGLGALALLRKRKG